MERRTSFLGKRPRDGCLILDDDQEERKFHKLHKFKFKFKVLLPNGETVNLTFNDRSLDDEVNLEEFVIEARKVYERTFGANVVKGRRKILWRSPDVYVEDHSGIKMKKSVVFQCFAPNKTHILTLHDGVKDTATKFKGMWDLTPDTEMLMELPDEYTFETALADLIDNSLQAVWSNGCNERRMVSVTIEECGLSVFDTGPGMDCSDKNSIVRWGKMGASLHRSSRSLAIGGKPPYLTPSFGMFGYGGAIASMHLGRLALVSSKTKDSKKVYTLHLEREALLRSGGKTWKTDGGIRDPEEDEISLSPHGSFTKVEIKELKVKRLDTDQLRRRLKDIYFPYIQCDEMLKTGRTSTPIEFQVNGDNLAELEGGEVAITNILSSNGPEFVFQLKFVNNQVASPARSPGSRPSQEANARLKCVYFPIVEGKENIDRILEKLKVEGFRTTETFDTFSRASVRRLGRLLPEARWGRLPFMEPRQRKGDRAQVLKRCCMRVKCFIDTDAGFNPTPSKTDLAHQHSCTIAMRNFGGKPHEKDTDVSVEIYRDGKLVSLSQLEKEYEDWIFQMHEYDEEIVCGEDKAVLVLCPHNKKELGISSDVVRVHKVIKRKGNIWKSGQNIKILKGAVGCHKNNIYATLEFILLEGLEGEACGEARLICRPLHVPVGKGCLLKVDDTTTGLDIQDAISFPISVIDSGKCKSMDAFEWEKQVEKLQLKAPSRIDILNADDCRKLSIDGVLDLDAPVYAENINLKKIIAVLRPASYNPSSSSRSLDQKFIIKNELEMSMEVTYLGEDDDPHKGAHVYAQRINSSSHNGVQGLYIFLGGSEHSNLFQNSGIYQLLFAVKCGDSSSKKCEKRLTVLRDTRFGQWIILRDEKCPTCHVRVGSHIRCVSIARLDKDGNHIPFMSTPEVLVKLESAKSVIGDVHEMRVELSSNKLILRISDIWIKSSKLDCIRPQYRANLVMSSLDKLYHVRLPCQVTPGPLYQVKAVYLELEKPFLPGSKIEKLVLEILDKFGNHIEKGVEVTFNVDGLCFEDHSGSIRKVDEKGYIDLSGLLKVKAGYGKKVSLSAIYDKKICFKKEFKVEKRMLKIVSEVPEYCPAGSQLQNVVFEIVDSEGVVDESIHHNQFGIPHTLKIVSEFPGVDDSMQYNFCRGRCTVPSIHIPQKVGICKMLAAHSNHSELSTHIQLRITQTPNSQIGGLDENDGAVSSQCFDRGMLLLQYPSACLSENTKNLVESIMKDSEELECDVDRAGMRIGEHEKTLRLLIEKKEAMEREISVLQASIEPQALSLFDYKNGKEGIVKRIEEKGNTAASVICKVWKVIQSQKFCEDWTQGIIGIVALMGTVPNDSLSRIFAEYLGEDHMLAVVCENYATGRNLEKYKEHGRIDHYDALHEVAAEFGTPIDGRFLIICLEDISPYAGRIESFDPQRKLVLTDPVLPTGSKPPGFLGYAVNMVNLDAHHLSTKTTEGYGLRETLFYLLFGTLQVYETREFMKNAYSCINDGAVSLDGGIIRGNGILSLGSWEPVIRFPVALLEVEEQLSQEEMITLSEITHKKLELESTCDEIEKEQVGLSEDKRDFEQKKVIYEKFLKVQKPMVDDLSFASSQVGHSEDRRESDQFQKFMDVQQPVRNDPHLASSQSVKVKTETGI